MGTQIVRLKKISDLTKFSACMRQKTQKMIATFMDIMCKSIASRTGDVTLTQRYFVAALPLPFPFPIDTAVFENSSHPRILSFIKIHIHVRTVIRGFHVVNVSMFAVAAFEGVEELRNKQLLGLQALREVVQRFI